MLYREHFAGCDCELEWKSGSLVCVWCAVLVELGHVTVWGTELKLLVIWIVEEGTLCVLGTLAGSRWMNVKLNYMLIGRLHHCGEGRCCSRWAWRSPCSFVNAEMNGTAMKVQHWSWGMTARQGSVED